MRSPGHTHTHKKTLLIKDFLKTNFISFIARKDTIIIIISGVTAGKSFRITDGELWSKNHVLISSGTHQYDDVHPGLHQQIQSVLVVLPGADGGTAQQLFARVFGGQWVISVLLQICPGDDGHQLVIIIHYGEFAW